MKLTEIAVDRTAQTGSYHRLSHLRLGRFSDGLNFIYGENHSGKTALREFVRSIFFGEAAALDHRSTTFATAATSLTGHLILKKGVKVFQVDRIDHRESAIGGELRMTPIAGSSRDAFSSSVASHSTPSSALGAAQYLDRLLGEVTPELYETVFSFSFRQTHENAQRLLRQLHSKLGVSSGIGSRDDESSHQAWKRDAEMRVDRLNFLKGRIGDLQEQRNRLQNQITTSTEPHRARLLEIDREADIIGKKIATFDVVAQRHRLKLIETEIHELRRLIEGATAQVSQVTRASAMQIDPYAMLYQRLDEIEDQIRCWRRLQTEIQNQRVRLKDEMAVWEDLTLDCSEHPYHVAREILHALEGKTNLAENLAAGLIPTEAPRVTGTNSRTLGDVCQSMRVDLHGLCQELSQQYKHLRHRSAAAELKQLRHYYHEINDSIHRLLQGRESVMNEVRRLDPAGADAISRAEHEYCQCAMHEGYLEARRRFVNVPLKKFSWQSESTLPTMPPAQNRDKERNLLNRLEREHAELVQRLNDSELELSNLKSRHASLVRESESVRLDLRGGTSTSELNRIETELQQLHAEYELVLNRVEEDRRYVRPTAHSILLRAAELLRRLSEGELTQIWISDSSADSTFQIRDAVGKVFDFSALERVYQDQVYLCLAVAAKEYLESRHAASDETGSVPMMIDDAFANIPPTIVDGVLKFYSDLADSGHQIFLLTQHRYLADRLPGTPVFELDPINQPARYESSVSTSITPSVSQIPIEAAPVTTTSSVYSNRRFDSSSSYHLDVVSLPESTRHIYPYSKYPPCDEITEVSDFDQPLDSHFNLRSESDRDDEMVAYVSMPIWAHSTGSTVPVQSVSVDQIGEPLGYVVTIDDRTSLDSIDLFSIEQLRALSEIHVETVEDLLAHDPNLDNGLLRDAGISAEQINRWQAILWMLCHVPGLRTIDARILVACGITEPAHLATSHANQLHERIGRFLASSEGGRFRSHTHSISIERVQGWLRSLSSTRPHWQNHSRFGRRERSQALTGTSKGSLGSGYYGAERLISENSFEQEHTPRQSLPIRNHQLTTRIPLPRTSAPALVPAVAQIESESDSTTKTRYYLDLQDHVEAAPSIGPKTAERFEKIGVVSVSDFLKQTAESMATKLQYKRITAEVVRQWQHQTRLVCRIPNLRGHDAQLLVACNFTEPEKIATMQPRQLLNIIGSFADTKEGMRIIRSGKRPDLAEVTDWITWAAQTRSLQAA